MTADMTISNGNKCALSDIDSGGCSNGDRDRGHVSGGFWQAFGELEGSCSGPRFIGECASFVTMDRRTRTQYVAQRSVMAISRRALACRQIRARLSHIAGAVCSARAGSEVVAMF